MYVVYDIQSSSIVPTSDWHTVTFVEMPSFSAFNDSARCFCRIRRSCCMSSSSAAFNDSGLVELWVLFCGQNTPFLYLQAPGVDIVMDYWLVKHPTDQHTHKKRAGDKLRFFCPILTNFLRMTLSSSLPLVTHIGGHMARTPLRSKLPCLASF